MKRRELLTDSQRRWLDAPASDERAMVRHYALCECVAEQIGLDATHFGDYAERDQTRREHVLEIQAALALRPLNRVLYREIAAWLLPMPMPRRRII